MSRCRACKTPKWKGDPCPNADCQRNMTLTVRLKSKTLPTTATNKHGYHAVNTNGFMQATSDYDAPIRSQWRRAS
jgi:hypothetical protein